MASTSKPNPRQAALLAAEARLRGTASPPLQASSNQPSASSAFSTWTPPTTQQDTQTRLILSRILDRQIMSHHSYATAEKCLGTLGRIVGNILDNRIDEGGVKIEAGLTEKYRDLKAKKGGMLYRDVLEVKGGEDFLVAIGFRTKTILFEQHYILAPSPANYHTLDIAKALLDEHLKEAHSRSTHAHASSHLPPSNPFSASTSASSTVPGTTGSAFGLSDPPELIAARKSEALRSIEDDRIKVKERVEREKIGREARMAKEARETERAARAEAEDSMHAAVKGEEAE